MGELDPTSAVIAPLHFGEVREFQQQYEGMIALGCCFVPSTRPMASDLPVRVKLSVAGVGEAELEGLIDYNDVDSYGRNGQIIKLTPQSVEVARALYEKCTNTAPVAQPVGEQKIPDLPFPSVVAPPAPIALVAPVPVPAPAPVAAPVVEPPKPDLLADLPLFSRAGVAIDAAAIPPASVIFPEPKPPPATTTTPPPVVPTGKLEPGTLLDNRFHIEAQIASSPTGDVYRASHVSLKRPIALKLLPVGFAAEPDAWAKFQRQAEQVSQLDTEHVVRIFDFGRLSNGQAFVAKEHVQGLSLDALVQRDGSLTAERAVPLLKQICDGLAEVHAVGLVHRHLRPRNVVVGARRDGAEFAKLLEFGIERVVDPKAANEPTPYRAPELGNGQAGDARSDVYSLGCLALFLLTGEPPSVASLGVLQDLMVALPALPEVIERAVAADRALRFKDVRELSTALDASLHSSSSIAGPDGEEWLPTGTVEPVPEDHWPPDDSPGVQVPASTNPAMAAAQAISADIDSFFSMELPTKPAPAPAPTAVPVAPPAPVAEFRLEKAARALGLELSGELLKRVSDRRRSVAAGARKTALLHVEPLRAPTGSKQRARCLSHLVELAFEHGGVVDGIEDNGVTVAFPNDEVGLAAARAAWGALAAREALAMEAADGAEHAPPTIRAGLAYGVVSWPEPEHELSNEVLGRARTLSARAPAGRVVAEAAVTASIADIVELAETNLGDGVQELVDRKLQLKANPQLLFRDGHLQQLDKRLSSLGTGLQPALVITGERGGGKTALAAEIGVRARHHQATLGTARGIGSIAGQPYAGVAEILCNLLAVPKDQRAQKLQPALEALKLPGPELEAALVISGVRFVPQPFTPGQVAYALRSVIALAQPARRVVLVFDGLESMDAYTVDCFKELAARPVARELVLGLCEPAFAKEALGTVPSIPLTAFSRPQVAIFIQAQLGAPADDALIDLLIGKSRGQPGPLSDWLHLLSDRGQLRLHHGHVVLTGDAPELDDPSLLRERVKAVWPWTSRLFEAVSLMGDTVEATVLTTVLPATPQPSYQRLANSRLLRALGGRRFSVASERYRLACLALPSDRRAMIHRRLAVTTQPDPEALAVHHTRGGEPAKALPLWRELVDGALQRRQPRETMAALRGWAEALTSLAGSGGGALDLGRSAVETYARAAAHALTVLEPALARTLVDEATAFADARRIESAELSLVTARLLRSEARKPKAAEALEQASKLTGQGPLLAMCLAERAETLEAEGKLPDAIATYQQAIAVADAAQPLARWHAELDLKARLFTRIGAALFANKELDRAHQAWTQALSEWRRVSYPYAEARVLANLGTLYVQQKNPEDAASCFKESSVCASRAGDLLFQARQLINLARVAKRFEAHSVVKQAIESATRLCLAIHFDEGRKQLAALTSDRA